MSKTGTFTSFRVFTVILFLTGFDDSESVLGSFFTSLRKSDLKTCIAALNPDFFIDLFYLVTWDDLDRYHSHKAQEMIQMSVTLSMPIHWLCLRLTSELCSPMSSSPKSQTFWLWPDLWRHQWPLGQISHHVQARIQGALCPASTPGTKGQNDSQNDGQMMVKKQQNFWSSKNQTVSVPLVATKQTTPSVRRTVWRHAAQPPTPGLLLAGGDASSRPAIGCRAVIRTLTDTWGIRGREGRTD